MHRACALSSHFGSRLALGYGGKRTLHSLLVRFVMAAAIVADVHGRALRHLCEVLDEHFQGLHQATLVARRRRLLSNKLCKRLRNLELCQNILRHISSPFADGLMTCLVEELCATTSAEHCQNFHNPCVRGTINDCGKEQHELDTEDYEKDTGDENGAGDDERRERDENDEDDEGIQSHEGSGSYSGAGDNGMDNTDSGKDGSDKDSEEGARRDSEEHTQKDSGAQNRDRQVIGKTGGTDMGSRSFDEFGGGILDGGIFAPRGVDTDRSEEDADNADSDLADTGAERGGNEGGLNINGGTGKSSSGCEEDSDEVGGISARSMATATSGQGMCSTSSGADSALTLGRASTARSRKRAAGLLE